MTSRIPLAIACLIAAPVLAQGQPSLFGELLREGQTVEVIDDQGRETSGKVGVVRTMHAPTDEPHDVH